MYYPLMQVAEKNVGRRERVHDGSEQHSGAHRLFDHFVWQWQVTSQRHACRCIVGDENVQGPPASSFSASSAVGSSFAHQSFPVRRRALSTEKAPPKPPI